MRARFAQIDAERDSKLDFFFANPKEAIKRLRRKAQLKHAAWRDKTNYGKGVALEQTLGTAADGDAPEVGDASESAETVEEAEEESEGEYEVICDICYDGKDAGKEDARGWMAEIHASGPEFAPPFPAMPAGTAGTDEVTTYSKAEDVRRDLLKKARDIVSTANNRKAAKVNAKARKTFSRNRKKATRRAMADGPRASLEAITTSDGTVTEDTTEVLREVTRHFRERQTPRPAVPDLLPFQDSPG